MPKKDGVIKTYSFSSKTVKQIEELCDYEMLKPTSLLEFLINAKHREMTEKVNK